MLRQRIIGILVFLCLIVALSSCGSSANLEKPSVTEEVPQSSAQPAGTEDSAAVDLSGFGENAEENLQVALANCIGWGGTAGSSLSAVNAASMLMAWANDNSLKDSDNAAVEAMLKTCYNNMNSEEQQNFRQNWQTISDTADMILTDYKAVSDNVEDAGCADRVDMIRKNINSASNWAELKTGFAKLLDE